MQRPQLIAITLLLWYVYFSELSSFYSLHITISQKYKPYCSVVLLNVCCVVYLYLSPLLLDTMPAQNFKAIAKRYFTEFPEDISKWKCRCGKILTQKPNTGWSNLFQHIKSQNSDYIQDAQSTLQSFVVSKPTSTKKAANIYSWLEWICCGLKPFNFVENDLRRLYCNLAPIAENTLKKYMEIVTKEVEVVIKPSCPVGLC